jgi:hypothetical protein
MGRNRIGVSGCRPTLLLVTSIATESSARRIKCFPLSSRGKAGRFAYGDLFCDHTTYLKRGCRRRGRRVANVDRRRAIDYQEVIYQPSVGTQGLCSNTRLARNKIIFADLWDQFLQAAHKRFLTERSMHFFES